MVPIANSFIHYNFSQDKNIFEAISSGASSVVELIFFIAANLIVYIALLAFIDNVIFWLADMIGWDLTFQARCAASFFHSQRCLLYNALFL